jgi:hypothetical protein
MIDIAFCSWTLSEEKKTSLLCIQDPVASALEDAKIELSEFHDLKRPSISESDTKDLPSWSAFSKALNETLDKRYEESGKVAK